MPVTRNPETWVNWPLVKEPMNWAIIGVMATLALLGVHFVVQGFTAMQGQGDSIGGGAPGTIAAPLAPSTIAFATPGNTGGGGSGPFASGNFQWFGTDPTWSDGFEAKYAEDGWIGDP